MYQVMVAGAGNIGSLIACLLANSGDYHVYLADLSFARNDIIRLLKAIPGITTVVLDVQDNQAVQAYLKKKDIIAVIASLPYYLTASLAEAARKAQVHYFDLTEDVAVTKAVKGIADGAQTAFVPQCGLAPGVVSIIANSMMQRFVRCDHTKLRVGALPQRSSHALHYSLTWSTDGMINEYGNLCYGIEQGKLVSYAPLEGLEAVQLEGKLYEAFNTSGGLGSLAELYEGRVQTLTYKTLRYPGHCDKMRLLMNDLKLNEDRTLLKHILEKAIPRTYQDVVIIYVSVEGIQDGVFLEENYFKKIYPKRLYEIEWSAIQIATASGVCAVADCVLTKADDYHGLILQEKFSFSDILANRFGGVYAPE